MPAPSRPANLNLRAPPARDTGRRTPSPINPDVANFLDRPLPPAPSAHQSHSSSAAEYAHSVTQSRGRRVARRTPAAVRKGQPRLNEGHYPSSVPFSLLVRITEELPASTSSPRLRVIRKSAPPRRGHAAPARLYTVRSPVCGEQQPCGRRVATATQPIHRASCAKLVVFGPSSFRQQCLPCPAEIWTAWTVVARGSAPTAGQVCECRRRDDENCQRLELC